MLIVRLLRTGRELAEPRARLCGRALNSIQLAFRHDGSGSFALPDRRLALADASGESDCQNDRAQDYEDLFHMPPQGIDSNEADIADREGL